MDTQLNDLPLSQADSLRNRSAERKLYQMGQKWTGDGQSWVNQAKQTAQQNQIPLHYIVNTIEQENKSFNPALKSSDPKSSATGLGQFVKGTAQHLKVDPTDPLQSIQGIGDYLGEIKRTEGYNNFGDLRKAYVMGPTGYKKYQQGEHVTGEEYVPNIDKFLAANKLGGEQIIGRSPKNQNEGALAANFGPTEFEGADWEENPSALKAFMANPKRIMGEVALDKQLTQLRDERNKIEHTPYSAIQNLNSIQSL